MLDPTQAKQLAAVTAATFGLAISVSIGVALGHWLDGRWGTDPWLTFALAIVAFAAGLRQLFALQEHISDDPDHPDPPR